MKKTLLIFLSAVIVNTGLLSQVLYSSSNPVDAFAPGVGVKGTPIIAFDDVNIPANLVAGSDSIAITKLRVGLYRTANAPSTTVKVYYTVLDDTASLYNNLIKIPPVLIGTFSLPANGTSAGPIALTIGDSISTIFKVKTDTGALYSRLQTLFVGISISDPAEENLILLADVGDPNDNIMWIYDVDNTQIRYAASFGGTNAPSATFYIQAYGKTNLLPVTISTFKGERRPFGNLLIWTTLTEQNNKGFEIQRSADGENFSTIAFTKTKASTGNSTSSLSYEFTDESPLDGNVYYRLKQIDVDNRAMLTSVVLLKGVTGSRLVMSALYPNPANKTLNVVLGAPVAQKLTVIITDLAGRVIMQQAASVTSGNNNLQINVSKLLSGSYTIKIICADGCETSVRKFFKQ